MQILTFSVGDLDCALEMPLVIEVARMSCPRRRWPAHGADSVELRGRELPLVPLRRRFCVAGRQDTGDSVIIAQTARQTVALQVDKVRGVHTVSSDAYVVSTPPLGLAPYVCGAIEVDGHPHYVLDVDRVSDSMEADLPGLQAAASHVQERLRAALRRD